MRFYLRKKHLFWICAVLMAGLLILAMAGCTKRQEKVAVETGGAVSRALGLPSFVGEALVTAICSALAGFGGHKNGRRKERRCQIKSHEKAAT